MDNLISNGTFTDHDGNASKQYWQTNTLQQPIRIPGGRHQLSLEAGEYISQTLHVPETRPFKVHYSFQIAASNPSPSTYINGKVDDGMIDENVDIVVNNKVLHLREHKGMRIFTPRDGSLDFRLENRVLNRGRYITLTDIRLWIEPV